MKTRTFLTSLSALASALILAACSGPSDSAKQSQAATAQAARDQLTPAEFNALAVRRHMPQVAARIEETCAAHNGLAALAAQVPADPESQSLFRRNWGPKCLAPATRKNPDCSAIPGAPKPIVDVWPAALGKTPQTDSGF